MRRRRGEQFDARALKQKDLLGRGLGAVVFATMVLTPVVIDLQAKDAFRYPKELVVRTGCILVCALLASAAILNGWRWPFHSISKRIRIASAAVVAWTTIAALTATSQTLAIASAVTVLGYYVFFLGVSIVAVRRRSLAIVLALLIPAAINAVVLLLQAGQIWNPFSKWLPISGRVTLIALLGNVGDVGGYLAPAALIAVAASLAMRSKTALAIAIICLSALIASQSLTAIVASTAGLIALSALLFFRRPAYVALVIALIAGTTLLYGPLRRRTATAFDMLRQGKTDAALSDRLTAFVAAVEMIRDHPIAGVGPGCYAFNYFDYKIRAEVLYPVLAQSMSRSTNFAETHNDHLQIASEIGIPGYLICLTALIIAFMPSFRSPQKDSRAEFARLSALPTATVLFVSALAHFPMHLATSALIYVCAFGITSAWDKDNAS